ncbi:MAG TPA: hypothetical protein PLA68_17415, partial [Panacibacter sp.]|nr:hypothetical protein [Panacibacter sp.]
MKTLFMIAIAATTYNLLSAQSTFRKSTNGPGFDQGYAVIQTNDKGLCVTGSASSFGSGNDDLYVIKLDSNFTQQWAKSFDWGRHEIGLSVIETRKGNMVVTGYTYKDIISDEQWDMFVMKIDRYGNVLWSKTIGGVKRENGNCITEISSGDLLIAGSTNSYGKGLNDIYLVRLSTNGDLVWAKTLGTTTDDIAYSISKTWNDDVIIAGASNGFRPFLAKCDADGNVLWAKTIAGDAASIGVYNSAVCTKDGGYAATGYTKTAANGYDVLTTKVNALGNVVWST